MRCSKLRGVLIKYPFHRRSSAPPRRASASHLGPHLPSQVPDLYWRSLEFVGLWYKSRQFKQEDLTALVGVGRWILGYMEKRIQSSMAQDRSAKII